MSGEPVYGLLQVYNFLKTGDLENARRGLEDALQQDLENAEILYTLKCVNFWEERLRKATSLSAGFERGEYILTQWKQFIPFLDKIGREYDKSLYAVKHGIFSIALDYYQSLFRENDTANEPEVYRRTGLCFKELGDYERALQYLEAANTPSAESAAILSELADCYALCGEVRSSKVLFREAFFIGAQKIELPFLESDLICGLVRQVKGLGYSGAELQEWIPVYGVLYGVFNVKRELRALELGKLKQTIYALENGAKEKGDERTLLIPRLINHYFWLIDHYLAVNDDKTGINEILLKIKLLDPNIHSKYTM